MNKYRFAFDTIKLWVKPWEVTEDVFEEGKPNRKTQFLEIIEELVEKATPKKVIVHGIRPGREINTVSYTCPVCDKHIGVDNFCKHCGQSILWSESEEQQ